MLAMHARTLSGSTYTMTADGALVVQRAKGHPLGSTTHQVRSLLLQRTTGGVRLRLECRDGVYYTSNLVDTGRVLPRDLVAEGRAWHPAPKVRARTEVDGPKGKPSGWMPPVTQVPTGVPAALAVYGD